MGQTQPGGLKEKAMVPRAPRHQVVVNAHFETPTNKGRVAVRNMSCAGAMLEGEGLPASGRDIILEVESLELFGTVVWSDGERCGVHFDRPLQPVQVLELHRITPEQVRSAELNAAAEWFNSQRRAASF